jgi:PhnB protein
MSKIKPIPEGFHSVTPYLIIKNADAAIKFYKKAFNAKEAFRISRPDGKVGHADIVIGDSHIMLCEEILSMNAKGPDTLGGSSVTLHSRRIDLHMLSVIGGNFIAIASGIS